MPEKKTIFFCFVLNDIGKKNTVTFAFTVTDIPQGWSDMAGLSWIKVELGTESQEYIRVWKLFKASNPDLKMVDKVIFNIA